MQQDKGNKWYFAWHGVQRANPAGGWAGPLANAKAKDVMRAGKSGKNNPRYLA